MVYTLCLFLMSQIIIFWSSLPVAMRYLKHRGFFTTSTSLHQNEPQNIRYRSKVSHHSGFVFLKLSLRRLTDFRLLFHATVKQQAKIRLQTIFSQFFSLWSLVAFLESLLVFCECLVSFSTHPSGAKSIPRTFFRCPSRGIIHWPVLRSHTRPRPSSPLKNKNKLFLHNFSGQTYNNMGVY